VTNSYVALIRAINVGGHSVIKMPDLRKLVESLGFEDVSSYIQTGNVVFKAVQNDRGTLSKKIEEAIEAKAGYKTTVFVLTYDDLKEAAGHNPFRSRNEAGEGRSHIVFLSAEPAKQNIDKILALQGEDFSFAVHKNFFYYYYPEKYAGHTRRNVNFEKILGVRATARTYKVVDRLIELAGV
jgi:uncharacterized protein (DUF1697 family)